MQKQVWVKGNKEIAGYWKYNWAADSFTIILNQVDQITGQQKEFTVKGNKPEFNGWRIKNV